MEIITSQDYELQDLSFWQDPETNIQYPIKWQLKIPQRNVNLIARAIVPDQVIEGSSSLYEGNYQVNGIFQGQIVAGRAQLELMP